MNHINIQGRMSSQTIKGKITQAHIHKMLDKTSKHKLEEHINGERNEDLNFITHFCYG